MTSTFRYSLGLSLVFLVLSVTFSCTRTTDSNVDGAAARKAGPVLDPGELTESTYKNSFLNLEVPLISGWETGDHNMVVKSLESWNPDSGIQTVPSVFLLTTGAPQTEEVQKVVAQYFLQIESTTLYPEFESDPRAYLAAVGEQLVTMAGRTVNSKDQPMTLGNREVHQMDVSFMFGSTPAHQTYYSWEDKGLFVNLVFTYASEADWDLLSSSVLDKIVLN